MPDRYTKARPPGYHNALLTGTYDEFKKLLTRYAICPPNDIGGYRGDNLSTIRTQGNAPQNSPRLAGTTRSEDIRMGQVQGAKLVAYIDLRLTPRGGYAVTGNEGGDRIYFDADYNAQGGYVPVYFLPWDSDGAAVRLTIPAPGVNNPDPDIFFTAAINGCSIFFQGTRQNPTIYHCGGGTGFAKAQITEAEEFWQEVVDDFVGQDAAAGRANLGNVAARSVGKSEYVATPGYKSKPDVGAIQSFTTPRALKYQKQLKRKHGITKLTIEEVSPWGSVLGRRDNNGDWTFFLQENATIIYHQVDRSLPNLFKGVKTPAQYVARPLKWKEIFPNGPGHHTMKAAVPKIH
jgi:hypothetical protein